MQISCPECDAGYEVPDALLRTARMMRCAACGHDWMTEPLEAAASAAPAGNDARPSRPPPSAPLSAPAPAPRPSAAGGPVTQQISCPNCSAVYDIPAVMLASPRSMRCATCGHDWVTGPLSGEAGTQAAAAPGATSAPPTPAPQAAAPQAASAAIPSAAAPPPGPPAPPPPAPSPEPASALPPAAAAPPQEEAATEPVAQPETPAAEPDTAPETLSVDERAELEAMRAAQATSQQEPADAPPSFRDRLQGGLRTNAIALAGWAATVAVLYLAARGAMDNREALVQLWPPGQRIFNWLGIS